MKKILLYSRDPGGANTVWPLYQSLHDKNYKPELWGIEVALGQYHRFGLEGHDLQKKLGILTPGKLIDWIRDSKFDFVITGTSGRDVSERWVWKACEALSIPNLALLDHWTNYRARFIYPVEIETESENTDGNVLYFPKFIGVSDKYAYKLALREGLPKERVIITGNPFFEMLKNSVNNLKSAEVVRKKLNIDSNEVVVSFISEPLSQDWVGAQEFFEVNGFNEVTVLQEVINSLTSVSTILNKKVFLIVKLHPREKLTKSLKEIVSKIEKKMIRVTVIKQILDWELLQISDVVVGMGSMMLAESTMLNKTTISVLIGRKNKRMDLISEIFGIPSISDKNTLDQVIQNIFEGNYNKGNTKYKLIDNPIERIIKLLDEHLR